MAFRIFILLIIGLGPLSSMAIPYEVSEGLTAYQILDINDQDQILARDALGNTVLITPTGIFPLSGSSQPILINNRGQMAGSVFLYKPNTTSNTDNFNISGNVTGLNDLGLLVGYESATPERAFALDVNLTDPPIQYFSLVENGYSRAFAAMVNANPVDMAYPHIVVGEAESLDGSTHAFAWYNGNTLDLGVRTGYQGSYASTVNSKAQVVVQNILQSPQGTLVSPSLIDLQQPNTPPTILVPPSGINYLGMHAYHINDQSYILAEAWTNNSATGLLIHNGETQPLNRLGKDSSYRVGSEHFYHFNNNNTIIAQDYALGPRIFRPLRTGFLQTAEFSRALSLGTNELDRSLDVDGDVIAYRQDTGSVAIRRFAPVGTLPVEQTLPTAIESATIHAASFGESIAVSQNLIAVGAPGETNGGAVYLYDLQQGQWQYRLRLAPANLQAGDAFGSNIKLQGDRLAIAAPNKSDLVANGGAVYTFHRQSNGEWTSDGDALRPMNHQADDQIGWFMDLDGDRLVLGSRRHLAWIYNHTVASWQEGKELQLGDANLVITSLAISGDRIVIKANSSLLEFVAPLWEEKKIQVRGNLSQFTLSGELLAGKQTYKKSANFWYHVENFTGNAFIVQADSLVISNQNRIERYKIFAVENPLSVVDLQVQGNSLNSAALGQDSLMQIRIKNNSTVSLSNVELSYQIRPATVELKQLPDNCAVTNNLSTVLCLMDGIPGGESAEINFLFRPNSLTEISHSATVTSVNDINASYSGFSNIVVYQGNPHIQIDVPRDGGTITLAANQTDTELCIEFSNPLSGSFTYEFRVDETIRSLDSRNCLGRVGTGDHKLTITAQNNGESIIVDGIPLSSSSRFRVSQPYFEILSPTTIAQHPQARYLITFRSNVDFNLQHIQWTLGNNETQEHRSAQPIPIPSEMLVPGSNRLIINVFDNGGFPLPDYTVPQANIEVTE